MLYLWRNVGGRRPDARYADAVELSLRDGGAFETYGNPAPMLEDWDGVPPIATQVAHLLYGLWIDFRKKKTYNGGVSFFNPTFHVYHNFRLKNFYILEKQPIIVEFLADFVSRGSVVKTEQKPTVGRSFDNNSRERGKSG